MKSKVESRVVDNKNELGRVWTRQGGGWRVDGMRRQLGIDKVDNGKGEGKEAKGGEEGRETVRAQRARTERIVRVRCQRGRTTTGMCCNDAECQGAHCWLGRLDAGAKTKIETEGWRSAETGNSWRAGLAQTRVAQTRTQRRLSH